MTESTGTARAPRTLGPLDEAAIPVLTERLTVQPAPEPEITLAPPQDDAPAPAALPEFDFRLPAPLRTPAAAAPETVDAQAAAPTAPVVPRRRSASASAGADPRAATPAAPAAERSIEPPAEVQAPRAEVNGATAAAPDHAATGAASSAIPHRQAFAGAAPRAAPTEAMAERRPRLRPTDGAPQLALPPGPMIPTSIVREPAADALATPAFLLRRDAVAPLAAAVQSGPPAWASPADPSGLVNTATEADWYRLEQHLRESVLASLTAQLPADTGRFVHARLAGALDALVARLDREIRTAVTESLREMVERAVRTELDRMRTTRG